MSVPRPKYSKELARLAAEEIVSELISGRHLTESQRQDSVDDIVEHASRHDDGYEIAQALDAHAHWDCDFQISEILDGYAHAVRRQIELAEKQWAKLTTPAPPLPIGSRVKVGRDETGEITGIYEYGAAKYLVKMSGDSEADGPEQSRRIVNFEDVEAAGTLP